MGKIETAISNSGPLIHLSQIESFGLLGIIKNIYITKEVFDEVCSFSLPGSKEVKKSSNIKVKDLNYKAKDLSRLISDKYSLDLGEATSISLAKQEKINLFLTDDLSAKVVAKEFGLQVHGSIGIILRAFRVGVLKKQDVIRSVQNLHKKSSMFITADLISYVIKQIEKA
ncbi:hypothetical protein A3K63_00940 [Candidatus Micrarchaeota archaeon RBG_16_49_10]|nr:MAG: hypothetical protein A3K63_00940 [Candidatus Micrarchaeota archaeon RBG_16_49_10]